MKRFTLLMVAVAASCGTMGCKRDNDSTDNARSAAKSTDEGDQHVDSDGHDHSANDNHSHDGNADQEHDSHDAEDDHGHDEEVDLGSAMIGDTEVSFAQGHGSVEPGKEGHLVVKLPYKDDGATVVRCWIGTDDRTLSFVGKGEYAVSHDDYDVHAIAPDPLPDDVMWWVEIEKPDGTTHVGAIKPLLE